MVLWSASSQLTGESISFCFKSWALSHEHRIIHITIFCISWLISRIRHPKLLTLFSRYLLNNGEMNPLTAGLSIFVSMLSALTIIGLPVEVYLYGDAMVMRMIGGILGIYTVNKIFLPKIFELKLYSIFRIQYQNLQNFL